MNAKRTSTGFTLVELMIGIMLFGILAAFATSFTRDVVPKQKLIAKSNELAGFFRFVRGEAALRGGALVCSAGTNCRGFDGSDLIAFIDTNNNKRRDAQEPVITRVSSPSGLNIYRNGWGKQNYLEYDQTGRLHYQNGHFLICHSGYGIRLIMNWRGRVRRGGGPAPEEECTEQG